MSRSKCAPNGQPDRRMDREGGQNREMRIVSVYELSGVGEQIAQSN